MKKTIFALFLLVSTVCFAQQPKNGWQAANLKGKVKAAGQVEYVVNEKNELVKEGQDFSAKFSPKGYIIEMNMVQGGEPSRLVMTLDDNGYPVKTSNFDEKGELTYRSVQENDANGNILKETGYANGTFEVIKTLFTYDAKGFLVGKEVYQFGNLSIKVTFTNDAKGNPIEEQNYSLPDNVLTHKILSTYDKVGNRVKAIAYDTKGEIMEHYTYKYDKHNNLIEEKSYNADGTLAYTKTMVYEYDKKNNWLKKNVYTDGKHTMVVNQFVEYY